LDYYADRTYRPGIVGEPPPFMRAYHVPPQVVRASTLLVSRMNLWLWLICFGQSLTLNSDYWQLP
jgi:hypothetical protein